MIRVSEGLKNIHAKAKMIIQVHDEVVIDCPVGEVDAVKKVLVDALEHAFLEEVDADLGIEFLIEPGDATIIVSRRELSLEREESGDDRPARGYLTISGIPFRPFSLGKKTWDNYVAWKREGGEEPAIPVVRSARRSRDDDDED